MFRWNCVRGVEAGSPSESCFLRTCVQVVVVRKKGREEETMAGPLAGVRILDCTTVVLGPWAAQQLGDLGADVIKVEPPDGDTTRQLGPMRNPAMGAFYLAVNRNKRSIVLDLKQEAARRVLLRL